MLLWDHRAGAKGVSVFGELSDMHLLMFDVEKRDPNEGVNEVKRVLSVLLVTG